MIFFQRSFFDSSNQNKNTVGSRGDFSRKFHRFGGGDRVCARDLSGGVGKGAVKGFIKRVL